MTVAVAPPPDHTRTAPTFTATIDRDGRVVLEGALDAGGVAALGAVLAQALPEAGEELVVDAAHVTRLAPAAVAELLRFEILAAARQCRLVVSPASPPVLRIVDALELRHVLMAPARPEDEGVGAGCA